MFRLVIIQLIQAAIKIPQAWWKGPSWLKIKENWSIKPDMKPSVESEKEVKISKQHKSIVITAVETQDDVDLKLQ